MDKKWDNEQLIKDIIPKIIMREEWKAVKPKKRAKSLKLPVNKVLFSNTNSRPCYTKEHCIHDLRKLQESEIERGSQDLPFNFLIGKDGNVYEGLGWKGRPDSYTITSGKDSGYMSIAFINDKDLYPSFIQTKRAMGLMIQGIRKKYISKKPKLRKDKDCKYLFSKTDFKSTMLELLGEEQDEMSESEPSDPEAPERFLTHARRIEQPYNYSSTDEDEAEYYKIKHKIREHNPDWL